MINRNTPQKLVIYLHVCLINSWREITDTILNRLSSSGLTALAAEIRIGALGSTKDRDELEQLLKGLRHNFLFHSENTELCERPTLKRIAADAAKEEFYALYLHTKGVTKPRDSELFLCIRDWTDYLLYWLVDNHGICLSKLSEGFKAVGCRQKRSHRFSGHFWWARSDHLRTCRIPGPSYQDQEYFLGLDRPERQNFCCIHSLSDDHFFYRQRTPRESYETDFQRPFEFYGRGEIVEQRASDDPPTPDLDSIGQKYNLRQTGAQIDETSGGGDKSSLHHGYLNFYQSLLGSYHPDASILEIGVKRGESLYTWAEFFHDGNVTGIDIDLNIFHRHQSALEDLAANTRRATIRTLELDATDNKILTFLTESFDIIIDDGSHQHKDIVRSFELLFPNRLKSGGTYFVEDVHSHLPDFQKIVSYFVTLKNGVWGIAHNNPWRNDIDTITFRADLIVLTKK